MTQPIPAVTHRLTIRDPRYDHSWTACGCALILIGRRWYTRHSLNGSPVAVADEPTCKRCQRAKPRSIPQ